MIVVYSYIVSDKLLKILRKIGKKDKELYENILNIMIMFIKNENGLERN